MSLEIFVPKFKKYRSPTQGRAQLLSPEGDVLWEDPDWIDNDLINEGAESMLDVWLKAGTNPAKYLCLIEGGSTPPAETSTMAYLGGSAGAREIRVPTPVDGYARQQIATGDWSAPALDSGDMQSSAAEKTFGPATSNAWSAITHVGLVTAATGQLSGSGKFLLFLALSGSTTVNIGQSLKYTLRVKAD